MSVNTQGHDGGPILPGTPLARALSAGAVPPLSNGFADRVVAAAEARPEPLPELRRRSGRWSNWRTGRRLAVGFAGVVALASAAAATGLLQQLAIPVPSAGTIWASISGPARAAPAPSPSAAAAASSVATDEAVAPQPVGIAGPIDTPEELGEAFRRVDALRDKRREVRRAIIDQRIADEIARRSAAGLSPPTPAELAAVRERIDAAQSRRQQSVDARLKERREDLQRRVEAGEAITRRDILRPQATRQDLPEGSEAFETLRKMTPRERREAWRALPPEQRAALAEEYRTRRAAARAPAPNPSAAPTPAE